MEHLRSLAPTRLAGARPLAVAALPARFEREMPLASAQPDDSADEPPAAPAAPFQGEPGVRPSRAPGRTIAAPVTASERSPPDRRDAARQPADPQPTPRRASAVSVAASAPSEPPDRRPLPAAAPVDAIAELLLDTRATAALAAAVPPARPVPQPLAHVPPSVPIAGPAARATAPLSAETLAGRGAPRALAPTVVHVTIDRIDVRSPAAPTRAMPPPAPRRPAPSVSLRDYLRRGASRGTSE